MNYFERILTDQKLNDDLCNHVRIEIAMDAIYEKRRGMSSESRWINEWVMTHPKALKETVDSFLRSAINKKVNPYIDPDLVEHYLGSDATYSDVKFLKSLIGRLGFTLIDKSIDSNYDELFKTGNTKRKIEIARSGKDIVRFIEYLFDILYMSCIEMAESMDDLTDCLDSIIVRLIKSDGDELLSIFLKSLVKVIDKDGSAIALSNRARKAILEL